VFVYGERVTKTGPLSKERKKETAFVPFFDTMLNDMTSEKIGQRPRNAVLQYNIKPINMFSWGSHNLTPNKISCGRGGELCGCFFIIIFI